MKILLVAYFLLAGVTWVSGEAGKGLSGRIAAPDAVAVLLIASAIVGGYRLRKSRLLGASLLLLLAFTPGILNTEQPKATLIEWLVHAFVISTFVAIYAVVSSMPTDERLEIATWWVRAGAVLACIGIYEFLGVLVGLPSVLAKIGVVPTPSGGIVGTFRNTGQAGIYYLMVLCTALPLQQVVRGARRIEIIAEALLLMLAVVLTVKRSAILALAIGIVLLTIADRSRWGRVRSVLVAGIVVLGLIPAVGWLLAHSESFEWRVQYKLGAGAAEQVESFARSNLEVTEAAVSAHPIVGVGLGGVAGAYSEKYEIHSTYLSIAASAGIVGVAAYTWFMWVFFATCYGPANRDPRVKRFGHLLIPLMVGLMVSFGYTYQLRKREFWITTALLGGLAAPEARKRRSRVSDSADALVVGSTALHSGGSMSVNEDWQAKSARTGIIRSV